MTKTFRYLYPALLAGYGKELQQKLLNLRTDDSLLDVFIDDAYYDKRVDEGIHILFKVTEKFLDFLKHFIKEHDSYQDDYEVGGFDSILHMVVFRIPTQRTYNNFLLSKYSKMYTIGYLEKFFKSANGNGYVKSYHILAKTEQGRADLDEKIMLKKELGGDFEEYDSKLNLKDEIFNYDILIKELRKIDQKNKSK